MLFSQSGLGGLGLVGVGGFQTSPRDPRESEGEEKVTAFHTVWYLYHRKVAGTRALLV